MGKRRSKRGRKRRNNRLKRWSLKGENGEGEGEGEAEEAAHPNFLHLVFFQVFCLFPPFLTLEKVTDLLFIFRKPISITYFN